MHELCSLSPGTSFHVPPGNSLSQPELGHILANFPGAQLGPCLNQIRHLPPELMLVGTDSTSGSKDPLPVLGQTSPPS